MGDAKSIKFTKQQVAAFNELMTGRFESAGHMCLFLSSYVGCVLGSAAAAGASAEDAATALAENQDVMRTSFDRATTGNNGPMVSQN